MIKRQTTLSKTQYRQLNSEVNNLLGVHVSQMLRTA